MEIAIHRGDLAVPDSIIQERRRAGGHTRQAVFAAVALVSLLLAAFLGWLSLPRGGACSGDGDAAVLRHERETLLSRQLEQFSCIRSARVQLPSRSWQPGAVIILEPSRPEAMPDANTLDRMLDVLSLVPDGPEKGHVLVFSPDGRRLYPEDETQEAIRRQREEELEQRVLRVLRPVLGEGRTEVLVSLHAIKNGQERARAERRTVSVWLEKAALPDSLQQVRSLVQQACALDGGRGDVLEICFLPARQPVALLRLAALLCLGLALAALMLLLRLRRRPAGGSSPTAPLCADAASGEAASPVDADGADALEASRLRLADHLREHPGQGVALLRHWLEQDDRATTPPGGRGSCS